jgi:hypothetical protein
MKAGADPEMLVETRDTLKEASLAVLTVRQ